MELQGKTDVHFGICIFREVIRSSIHRIFLRLTDVLGKRYFGVTSCLAFVFVKTLSEMGIRSLSFFLFSHLVSWGIRSLSSFASLV